MASLVAAAEQPVSEAVVSASKIKVHAPSRFMASTLLRDGWSQDRVLYADLPWEVPDLTASSGESRRSVMYFGRLAEEKGVDLLLRAWPAIVSEYPAHRLVIAGDGPSAGRLQRDAESLSLRNVEFVGRYAAPDLSRLLATAAVTVHPSRWAENSPFTVRESLMHGVPAVVSSHGGLPEMVGPETGRVLESDTPGSISSAVLGELAEGRALSGSLIEAVHQRAVTNESHLEWLHDTYEGLRTGAVPADN